MVWPPFDEKRAVAQGSMHEEPGGRWLKYLYVVHKGDLSRPGLEVPQLVPCTDHLIDRSLLEDQDESGVVSKAGCTNVHKQS